MQVGAPGALRVFRGTFVSQLMLYKAMMAKERCGTDGTRVMYVHDGPLQQFCARLLPLMSRLTALNLFIPSVPPLPALEHLKHLELHMSKLLLDSPMLEYCMSRTIILGDCKHV